MNPIQAYEILYEFGLNKPEAQVYVALLSDGPANGYEVAKATGLSRSNVYTALATLVGKGLARSEATSSVRYFPLPANEFVANRIAYLQQQGELLRNLLPQAAAREGGYLTIEGAPNIADTLRNMIRQAQERIYAALEGKALQLVQADLQKAARRGLKVVLISLEPVIIQGAQIHQGAVPKGQVRVITDSSWVLTGDYQENGSPTCLYSNRRNLVELCKDALRNEIKLRTQK
jgi:HTH-type transcriptional regulator, sugar sensing transcriptional regulator